MNSPSHWKTAQLRDVIVEMQSGFAQRPGATDAAIPQLRTNNVSPDGTLDLTDLVLVAPSPAEMERYRVLPGDVIFNNTNSIEWVGKTAYFDREETYLLSNHMTYIRVKADTLDAQFLARYLHYLFKTGGMQRFAKQWVSQAAIDQSALGQFDIPLPPLPEQRRIVAVLRQAEEIRRKRRETEETIQRLRLNLFEELFGNLREQSRWETVQVSDAGQVQLGRQRAPQYQTGAFTRPYVRVANVFEDYIDTSDILSMDFDERDFGTYRLEYDDILLNEGQSTELVGRPAIWRNEIDECCFQNTLVRFKADLGRTDPEFALAVFIQYFRNGEFAKISSKTNSIAHLGASRLASMPFPLPPLALQQSFSARIGTYRTLKENVSISRKQAETLFQSLLSQAFTGELTAAWRETHTEELASVPETVVVPETLETRLAQGTATAADLEEARRQMEAGFKAVFDQFGTILPGTPNNFTRQNAEPFIRLAQLILVAKPYFKEIFDAGFAQAIPKIAADQLSDPAYLIAAYTNISTASNLYFGLSTDFVKPVFDKAEPALQQAILTLQQAISDLVQQANDTLRLLARTPDTAHPRYHLLRDLSDTQYTVYLKVQAAPGYITPEMLHATEGMSLTVARRGLQVLARNGVIQAVSLPSAEANPQAIPVFVNAYRALHPEDDATGDFAEPPPAPPSKTSFAETKADVMGFNRDPNDRMSSSK